MLSMREEQKEREIVLFAKARVQEVYTKMIHEEMVLPVGYECLLLNAKGSRTALFIWSISVKYHMLDVSEFKYSLYQPFKTVCRKASVH